MNDGQSSAPEEPKETDLNTKTSRQERTRKEGRKRHGARNQNRHIHFAKWLKERFPKSFQESHWSNKKDHCEDETKFMHILDVAGGKGELAARLSMCLQQQVVLVDPRPADIVHCFETLVLPKLPNKWQKRIEDQRSENPDFVREKVHERVKQLVTTFDEHTLADNPEIQEAVHKASLLIGLHADGATEAIVDAAVQYRKPFVVVPCCVFPNLFPQRHVVMQTGQPSVPVRTHEQFCQFLLRKHAGFRLEILPFEGRNVAIWWDGMTEERQEPLSKESPSTVAS